jgi:two-component system, OmpR family, sensor histidine kinase RstB
MPLYLRFYLAILGSLVLAAAIGAGLWHAFGPEGGHRRGSDVLVRLAERALPPADSPASAQQAALDRLARDLPGSVALYGADGKLIASIGRAPVQHERRTFSSTLDDGRVLVARGSHPVRHRTPGFWAIFVLLLALGAAYLVARRLTRRLERLQKAVESLGTGELSARVPVEGKDEVARLAGSFNRAAGQIETLVGANRALLANASHELRTPLARIRMALELPGSERTADIKRDIAELDSLIDEILLASRLEAPQALALEDVDLLGLCAEEGSRYDGVQVEGTSATVRGELRLLRRLVRNLLENALRHGRPPVRMSVARGPEFLELRVRDAGEPVPPAERERIFEPFYRRAGSAYAGGAGLGLAIVRQIARRHGGEARYDDQGFVVTLKRNYVPGTEFG